MSELVARLKRNKKRLIIWGIIGFLLASLTIWFVGWIWTPMVIEVGDLLVYAPEDCDFVVFSRDFPRLIRGLNDREFMRQVDEHRGLQAWFKTPMVAETEILPRLRDAYSALQEVNSNLPFDLEVLGDISGRNVVVAGYEAENEGEDPQFLAIVQPESAMARMAVNSLLSPTLCSLFIEDQLPPGSSVEHLNWGVRLELPTTEGRLALGVARIEAAVVIGTRIDAIADLVRDMVQNGVPFEPSTRFNPGWVWDGAEASGLNIMVRRRSFDEKVKLGDWLSGMWGADLYQVFDQSFPLFEGRDLYLQLDIDRQAELKGAIGTAERRPLDPYSRMTDLEPAEIDAQMKAIIDHLPYYVFGYGLCGAKPADLLAFVLGQRGLMDRDQRELLFEFLAGLDRFKRHRIDPDDTPDLTGPLVGEVAEIFAPDAGFILFKKQRDEEVRHSAPGVAVVLKVADRAHFQDFLDELEVAADHPFHRFDDGPFTFWQVVRDSFLDDRENNKPAFALIGDYLVITNWVQLFLDMRGVIDGGKAGMPTLDTLHDKVQDLPPGVRSFIFLDPEQLYAHMDQAKEGWIAERSVVTEFEKVALRREAFNDWSRLAEPRPDQERWTQQAYERKLARKLAERSEGRIRAEIDRNLGYFRNAFGSLFLSVGTHRGGFQVDLQLATQEKY
ncbi:MAG: hypothetical protein H6807_13830 [Planctomycetes bacterium]|nr:hypothetical protein [Planctomycetota bacterium]